MWLLHRNDVLAPTTCPSGLSDTWPWLKCWGLRPARKFIPQGHGYSTHSSFLAILVPDARPTRTSCLLCSPYLFCTLHLTCIPPVAWLEALTIASRDKRVYLQCLYMPRMNGVLGAMRLQLLRGGCMCRLLACSYHTLQTFRGYPTSWL